MSYNPYRKTIDAEVEIPESGWAREWMKYIIWGDPDSKESEEIS